VSQQGNTAIFENQIQLLGHKREEPRPALAQRTFKVSAKKSLRPVMSLTEELSLKTLQQWVSGKMRGGGGGAEWNGKGTNTVLIPLKDSKEI